MEDKIKFMKEALKRAKKGLAQGEVPVGAVVVCDGKIIGSGYNRRTRTQMASSHAEMYAIDRACRRLKSWQNFYVFPLQPGFLEKSPPGRYTFPEKSGILSYKKRNLRMAPGAAPAAGLRP